MMESKRILTRALAITILIEAKKTVDASFMPPRCLIEY